MCSNSGSSTLSYVTPGDFYPWFIDLQNLGMKALVRTSRVILINNSSDNRGGGKLCYLEYKELGLRDYEFGFRGAS